MIIEITDNNSIVRWRYKDNENWKSAEISDLIKAYERPQGEWVKVVENISWHYECNQCHNRPLMARLVDEDVLSEFCPNCGADMRGKDNG